MKKGTLLLAAVAAVVAGAGTASAAGGLEVTGGVFLWVFLGFCALIVVGQLIPAVMLLFGLAKGIAEAYDHAEQLKSK
jgi:hypothetical protein